MCVQCVVPEKENPCPPRGRSLEIPRSRKVLKAKILEANIIMKLNWNFVGEGGCKRKKTLHGGEWIFSRTAQCICPHAYSVCCRWPPLPFYPMLMLAVCHTCTV